MSGGVDSSVAAALLKDSGYEVFGITLRLWPVRKEPGGCCGVSAINEAKLVAKIIQIPHYVLNFRQIFQEKVIDYFCATYLSGRTPNPCIVCNQLVKFGAFLEKAKEISADFVATGHYAKVVKKGSFYLLRKGKDSRCDQSYFLYTLSQKQLALLLFPLGSFTKEEVRMIAHNHSFPNAEKEASQDICFLTDSDYKKFIQKFSPQGLKPGPIYHLDGRLLGEHRGLAFYTIGQREGLGISLANPLYVVKIDRKRNALIVGEREAVFKRELEAAYVNWIGPEPTGSFFARASIRYRSPQSRVKVVPKGRSRVKVYFAQPQFAITPGQSVVFFKRGYVLGGGVIL